MRPRAVLTAVAIAAGLVAINVYMALRVGFTDTGNLLAATTAFALGRLFARPLAVEETYLVQAFASAAGACTAAAGLTTLVPSLAADGRAVNGWLVIGWGAGVATLGILAGASMRGPILARADLVFPTGRATAETITALHSGARAPATRSLALAAVLSSAITVVRDWLAWIPQTIPRAPALGIGLSLSPALLGIGALVGLATSATLATASLVAWGLGAPRLSAAGLGDSYAELIGWMTWPAVALMLSEPIWSALVGLRRAGRVVADVRTSFAEPPLPRAELAWLALASVVTIGTGYLAFGLHPLVTLAVLAVAVLPAAACAHAAGRADVIPGESGGQLTQWIVGTTRGGGAAPSMAAGVLMMGASNHAALALLNLKAGRILGLPWRRAIAVMAVGATAGVALGFGVYTFLLRGAVPGSAELPAPSMQAWRAIAASAAGGALPQGAPTAALAALAGGLTLAALRMRWPRLPSPVALGIGCILPAAACTALLVGGALGWLITRWRPAWAETHLAKIAAGTILGESLGAVGVGVAKG